MILQTQRTLRQLIVFNILKKNLLQESFKRKYTDVNYIKTSMTQLKPEEGFSLQITGYNQYGFSINQNITALGPIIIFPKTIFSWNVGDLAEVNEKSLLLFKMIEPKLDLLVIGTGDKYSKINPDIPKWLLKNKISNFEILPTEKAINTFNFLVGENRFIAAALLPTLKIVEPSDDVTKVFEKADLYKEIEPTPTQTKEWTKLKEQNANIRKRAVDYDNREHLESGKPKYEEKK